MVDVTTDTAPPETGDTEAPPKTDDKASSNVPPEMTAALRKANKEAETLRRQLKEYEDRDKSESEKLAERATAAEQRAVEAETAGLRYRVAVAKGLPAALVDRLRGDTEEELTADADQLLALLASPETVDSGFPDLGQGARPDALPLNGDPIERALRAKLGIR